MSDYISRQAAINAMESINDSICEQQAIDALCELPSEQPKIIRCKDCKFWDKDDDAGSIKDFRYCKSNDKYFYDNDFCSYGERKEQEHEQTG